MMRTSIIFAIVFSTLVACSLAAPVLDRRVRQTGLSASDRLNSLRAGMSVLSKYWRYRLSQSLNVNNHTCLDSNVTSSAGCQKLRSALNVTCRLYEANRILPSINLSDSTAQEALEIMSEKSLVDACIWVNETLTAIGSSGLPSDVQCSNVSTLAGVCSQWSDSVAIRRIESKVDALNPAAISEVTWINERNLTTTELFPGCSDCI